MSKTIKPMKRKFLLLVAMILVVVSAFGQATVKLGGRPAKKLAKFTDNRACSYYLVRSSELDGTFLAGLWQLVKVKGGKQLDMPNPYDVDGIECIKDAKLVGSNLYVINTSYRLGDNVACLNTLTGRWSNPIPACAQCSFIAGNKLKVKYFQSKRTASGLNVTEETIELK